MKVLSKYYFLIVLFVYFLAGIILFSFYRYNIQVDTIQYLSIAEQYASGHYSEAINSYWSPLLIWILAGFVKIGFNALFTMHVLQVIIGAFALYGVLMLIPFQQNKIIFFIHLSLVVCILSYAFLVQTPDLLFTTLIIWYLFLLLKTDCYFKKKYSFLLFGFIGAFMYFAKYPGFFAFIGSFSIFNFYHLLKKTFSLKGLIIKYILSISVFFVLSIGWVTIISKKENKFLVSSSIEYNFKIVGPIINPNAFDKMKHPVWVIGLVPPPYNHSIGAWEVLNKVEYGKWNAFENKKSFIHYLKVILRNLISVQSFYFGKDHGTVLFVLIGFLFFIDRKRIHSIISKNMLLILMTLPFTLPYLFVLVEERYIWINNIVFSLLLASIIEAYWNANKSAIILFTTAFCITLVDTPVYNLIYRNDTSDNCEDIFNEKDELVKYIHGNIASVCTDEVFPESQYAKSYTVSYLINSPYFGMITLPKQTHQLARDLKQYNIDYLFSWDSNYQLPDSLYNDKRQFNCGLVAYTLRKPG